MPAGPHSRRRFLAAATTLGAAALAGCTQLVPGDGAETTLRLRLDELDGTLRDRYVLDLSETPFPGDEDAFAAALDGSSYTTRHRKPFPERRDGVAYARRDGTYYHLDSVVVGEERVTHPVLRLHDVGRTEDLESPPEHVPASDLPDVDEAAVEIASLAARARGSEGGVPRGLVERDGYVYRSSETVEESRLLGSSPPSHVAFRERVYRVEVTEERFHESVYRPDVDPVAETPAEMEAVLRARVVDARLDPGTLPDAQRELLRTAMDDELTATPPFSEPLTALLRAMDHYAYVDGDVSKDSGVDPSPTHRVLQYGDRYYGYLLTLDESGTP